MITKKIAVMDIGSSEIRTYVLAIKTRKNFSILGEGIEKYSGFLNGEFLEADKLAVSLKNSIKKAQKNSSYNFKQLYVGIGGEFLLVKTANIEENFPFKTKIKQEHIDELIEKANPMNKSKTYTLINYNPVNFLLDDERQVQNAVGQKARNLKALFSFQFAETVVIDLLNTIFKQIGLVSVHYISAPEAALTCLLEAPAKKELAVIVDCGYISTYVLAGINNSLTALRSFSLGGAHIMTDLASVIKIDYEQAESLKRRAILTFDEESQDGYEILFKGDPYEVPANIVGDVIKARLDMIAQLIEKAIEHTKIEYPKYFPIFLTGGGMSTIKGAKQYLQKELGRPVEVINSSFVSLSKPYEAQMAALCVFAVQKELEFSRSFLAKLLGK